MALTALKLVWQDMHMAWTGYGLLVRCATARLPLFPGMALNSHHGCYSLLLQQCDGLPESRQRLCRRAYHVQQWRERRRKHARVGTALAGLVLAGECAKHFWSKGVRVVRVGKTLEAR